MTGCSIHIHDLSTPLGPLLAAAVDGKICLLEFARRQDRKKISDKLQEQYKAKIVFKPDACIAKLEKQLAEYFSGTRKKFSIPLAATGTDFQGRAWAYLQDIPYGKTRSYKDQAAAIGNKKAMRAVAGANGRNNIVILIPCHRVIGSDGTLTGYSAGLWRKEHLLKLEGIL